MIETPNMMMLTKTTINNSNIKIYEIGFCKFEKITRIVKYLKYLKK